MPNYGWQDIDVLLVDGFDVQPMTVVDLQLPKNKAVIEKLHGAGEDWATALATGEREADGDVQLRLPYATDTDVDTPDSRQAFVENAHVVDGIVCVGVEGNVAGRQVWAFKAHQLDYQYDPKAGEVTKLIATWTVNGALVPAKIVVPKQVVGADGNTEGTPLDNAASTANGGTAIMQAAEVDLNGHTGLAIKLRHSVDGITFADVVTFGTVTAARDAEIATVAGTVNRYLAATWDFTGSGTLPTAKVFVAFKRD